MFNKKVKEKTNLVKVASSRFYDLFVYEDYSESVRTYIIVNKEFQVVEKESENLPQALSYLEAMDTALAAAYDRYTDEEVEFKPVTLH